MSKRQIKKGQKYYVYNKQTGVKHLVVVKDPGKTSAMGVSVVVDIIDNGQELGVRQTDLFDYRWYDEYKPTVVGIIVSVITTVITAYVMLAFGFK